MTEPGVNLQSAGEYYECPQCGEFAHARASVPRGSPLVTTADVRRGAEVHKSDEGRGVTVYFHIRGEDGE